MKKCILEMSLILVAVLLLSGCGLQPGSIAVTYAQQTPTPATYTIEGQTIMREQGGDKTLIYDATEHYPNDWDCWLSGLAVEPDALYFSEGSVPRDTDSYGYVLIRIAFDGGNRIELDTFGGEYMQILRFGSRIFFVLDCMDSKAIGWASTDGSGSAPVDIALKADDGTEQILQKAMLYIEDGKLYADVGFSADSEFNGFYSMEYTVRINDDLSVERVAG